MAIHLPPKTTIGKWSVTMIIFFFVFLSVFYLLVALGQHGGETFFSNPWLALALLPAAGFGIAAFVCGVISITKKDYSILVLFATILGFIVLFFVTGELLFPH